MMPTSTRRSFLKASALGLTGAATLTRTTAAAEPTDPAAKTFQLTRQIPVEDGFDLVVAGGGPAGAAAAICAARLGAKVVLLEATGSLGGTGTDWIDRVAHRSRRSNQHNRRGVLACGPIRRAATSRVHMRIG